MSGPRVLTWGLPRWSRRSPVDSFGHFSCIAAPDDDDLPGFFSSTARRTSIPLARCRPWTPLASFRGSEAEWKRRPWQ
jgi:hypothetical protein